MPQSSQVAARAKNFIEEIRNEARAEYAGQLVTAIGSAIQSLQKVLAIAQQPRHVTPQSPNFRIVKTGPVKTAAYLKRERNKDLVYDVLTDKWQTTKFIFNRASAGGLTTSKPNCVAILRRLEQDGMVELNPASSRQQWRAI